MKTLVVVTFLLLILYNLGAALFYMIVDRGTTNRAVNALTRRIGLSVLLILLVSAALLSGVIRGHATPY
jgi:small neutral amino acid transporter SnatA (MarC family)